MSGATAKALRAHRLKIGFSFQRGQLDPKFQVPEIALTNHSSSQKTRLNNLLYGIKIWTDLSSVLSQCTSLADGQSGGQTDGRTDRQLSRDWTALHSMQRGKIQRRPHRIIFVYSQIVGSRNAT